MELVRALSIRSKIALGAFAAALVLASLGALLVAQSAEQVIRDAETTLANQDLDQIEAQILGRPAPQETGRPGAEPADASPAPPPTGGRGRGDADGSADGRGDGDGDRDGTGAPPPEQGGQAPPPDPVATATLGADGHPVENRKPDALLYAVAPDGTVVIDTMPEALHDDLGLEPGATADDGATTTASADAQAEGGEDRYTVVARECEGPSGTWHLWAARSGAGGDLTLDRLRTGIWIGAALIAAAFGLAAWLLAGAALRPVGRMQATAARLGERGPGERGLLPVGRGDDELGELATTLNALIQRTRDSSAREREMVSAASHELRTPIAVLTTQLELAHRSFGDAPALEQEIVAAQRSVRRLSSLASNLLELSRLDAGADERHEARVEELESEVMAAVDRGRLLAGADGPEIELELGELRGDASAALGRTEFSRILDTSSRTRSRRRRPRAPCGSPSASSTGRASSSRSPTTAAGSRRSSSRAPSSGSRGRMRPARRSSAAPASASRSSRRSRCGRAARRASRTAPRAASARPSSSRSRSRSGRRAAPSRPPPPARRGPPRRTCETSNAGRPDFRASAEGRVRASS